MQYSHLEHRFVHHFPDLIERGVLYVSMDYATAVHSCCCGCGEEVVTPLTPTDWKMTFDGETISLSPSIGNWNSPCRSHYIIQRSQIIEAGPWSRQQIETGRRRDKARKKSHYGESSAAHKPSSSRNGSRANRPSLWSRIRGWVSRRKG
jgi:hypothetical protein